MRVSDQALAATFGAAALEVRDLLHTNGELRLPRVFGDVDVFAVENLVDGVGAVQQQISAQFASGEDDVTDNEFALWDDQKVARNAKTHLQAVPSLR